MERSIHNQVKPIQTRIEKNHNVCAEFRYWKNGELQWCGHKLNILTATVSDGTRNLSSIHSQLSNGKLSTTTKFNAASKLDTRVASGITFAFEMGTRSLVTAWGPNVLLQMTHQYRRFDMFKNVRRGRFLPEAECEPFCNILKSVRWDVAAKLKKGKNDGSVVNRSTSPSDLSRAVSKSDLLYDCKQCKFGLSQEESCFDLLYACLGKDGVCSASQKTLPVLLPSQSFFCRGIYILYVDENDASCPLHIDETTLFSYSVYQLIQEILTQEIGPQVQVNITGTELDESIRTLGVSSKQSGGPIPVVIRASANTPKIIKKAIEEAINEGRMNELDRSNIDWTRTKDKTHCESDDSTEKSCTVQLFFKSTSR